MPPKDEHEVECLHPELWVEIRAELKAIQHAQNNMKSVLNDIHARMFVDNGVACHQTRLQVVEQKLTAIIWAVCVTSTALIGLVVQSVWSLIESRAK
ncbi:MAG: hypothetical protein NTV22_11275 [bacterium]|nr:hypothetical protein [bacterium]